MPIRPSELVALSLVGVLAIGGLIGGRRMRQIAALRKMESDASKERFEIKRAEQRAFHEPLPTDAFVASVKGYGWTRSNNESLVLNLSMERDGETIRCSTTSWDVIHAILGYGPDVKYRCSAEIRPRKTPGKGRIIHPIYITQVEIVPNEDKQAGSGQTPVVAGP